MFLFLIKQFLYSFLSTLGFSILFNAPRKSLIRAGITGASGWLMYIFSMELFNLSIASALIGSLTVGICGEIFARIYKKPATIFIIPGIVPLVPGSGMYYTMLAVVEKRFIDAANVGSETLFIAASIASGITISSSISKSLKRLKK